MGLLLLTLKPQPVGCIEHTNEAIGVLIHRLELDAFGCTLCSCFFAEINILIMANVYSKSLGTHAMFVLF